MKFDENWPRGYRGEVFQKCGWTDGPQADRRRTANDHNSSGDLKRLAANKYETRVALILAVNQYLCSRSISWFAYGIQMFPQRQQKCIDVSLEYSEKE